MFSLGQITPEFNLDIKRKKKSNTVNMKILLSDKVGVRNIFFLFFL